MGREFEEERIFSEEIDRLLSARARGEEASVEAAATAAAAAAAAATAGANEDFRSALEFARRMVDLRVSPSPQFESHLKATLLEKLAEKESNRAPLRGWFWKLIPSQPIFQAAVAMAVVFIVGTIVWATLFRPEQQMVVQAPVTPPVTYAPITPAPTTHAPSTTAAAPVTATPAQTTVPPATSAPPPATSAPSATALPGGANVFLSTSASTDKASYLPGEPVNIQVSLTNITSQPVEMKEFPPILSLMESSTQQPVYTFASGAMSRTLSPRETVSYILTWNQLDERNRHVAPGVYYLELEEVYSQGGPVRMDLTRPVYFSILPASGAGGLQAPQGLNQPVTANGITVTLTGVDSTPSGITVTASITPPPDYVLKQTAAGLNPTLDYRSQARYALNGNWFEKTAPSYAEYFADRMEQTWLVPVGAGVQVDTLDLVLDNVGGWVGPWEFEISLK